MITAGIDVGIETVKAVLLKDGKVLSRSMSLSGGANRGRSAEQVWIESLRAAGLSASDVSRVVATGQGKTDVKFANGRVTEPVADAQAARFLYPSSRSVIDVGADQVRVVTLGDDDKILEVVMNPKCAAGLGLFLRSVARTLGLTVEEMSQFSGETQDKTRVSDACSVFAELDVVALVHNNVPKKEIVMALNEAVATRINSVMNEKLKPQKDTTVFIGGVSRNPGVVNELKKRSGINFLIPEQPEFACALGAALIAKGN